MADNRSALKIACANVARAVFYHVSDLRRRAELERALLALVDAIESRIGDLAETIGDDVTALEARVEGLERDSHPAVPLRPIIIQEVTAAMKRLVHRPRTGG